MFEKCVFLSVLVLAVLHVCVWARQEWVIEMLTPCVCPWCVMCVRGPGGGDGLCRAVCTNCIALLMGCVCLCVFAFGQCFCVCPVSASQCLTLGPSQCFCANGR